METILARRRAIPQITSSNPMQRALGERMAINSVVQGSAADLIKVAMIDVQQKLSQRARGAKLILQIHDELVIEAPEDDAESVATFLTERMQTAFDLTVPLVAEASIGRDWFTAK